MYKRLMLRTPDSASLKFDTLALMGTDKDGKLDHDTLKGLIRLFRPERDGTLSLVNFAKSIDTVYKEVRLLRASVNNSSKVRIDRRCWHLFA
jgi:hypothetical protein